MSVSINPNQIATPEAPWLGLRSFTEDAQDYFFGRRAELEDLYERILDKPLTILFGQSGLGKSSLLQAALVPRLRTGGFLPVLVRFNHEADAPSLDDQMIEQLKEALIVAESHEQAAAFIAAMEDGLARADWDPAAFLWLLFHDPTYGFIPRQGESAAPLWRPVFLIDQFEEIFTLGERPARRAVSLAFRDGLASLVENRPPASLRSRLEEDDELMERLVYQARHTRVLLSLREDFLHVLERWHHSMPSIMENRFELRMLSGPQAFEAVVRPGQLRPALPSIIPDEVGQAIVRFVAGAQDDVPLAEIDAVPPLLSLVCAELNAQRLSAGEQQITRAQFEGHSDEILQSFYLRSFDLASYGGALDGIPDAEVALNAVKRLIEDRLLSPDGYRESIAFDTIARDLSRATTPVAAKAVLDEIVERRLLTIEERGGVRRLELAHDVLAPIVKGSRDERQEKEALASARRDQELAESEARNALQQRNRLRRWVALSLLLALFAILAATAAWIGLRKTREATDQAVKGFEFAISGLETIYDEYNNKLVANTRGLNMKEADILGMGLRGQLLPQLEELHRQQPNHRGCINLICRLTLDEIFAIRRQSNDWARAQKLREDAIAKLVALKNPSVQETEVHAELLLWRPLISSLEGREALTKEQDQELIPQLSKLTHAYPDSWRLSYIETRLENNLLFDNNASTAAFLAVAQKFNLLVERSGRNYDVVLWEFVTTANAYYDLESWKKMPLPELQRLIDMFENYFLKDSRYSLIQTEMAADRMKTLITRTAKSLIPPKDAKDLDLRQTVLQNLNNLLTKLEERLPSSPIVTARRGEYLDLEVACLEAGLSGNKELIQSTLRRHRERAAMFGVADSIRDTIADGFKKYFAESADQTAKAEAVRLIKDALKDANSLELSGLDTLVNDNSIASKLVDIERLSSDDPMFPVCQYLLDLYINAFSKASIEKRRVYLEGFSGKTQGLLARWNKNKEERGKIIELWDRCFDGIEISQESSGDRSGVVAHAKAAAVANISVGKLLKGLEIYAQATGLCEKILKDRPWDWYIRQAAIGLHFEVADGLEEAGQNERVDFLRRKAWQMLVEMTRAEIDLTKFKVLPKKGGVPPGATTDEAKFFNRFRSTEQGGSGMKMFVIPCDVAGVKVPVQFYILPGKAGYQGLLDQFRWIKEYRGVDVSADVQDSLKKLNEIAVENNVDFLELCTYALNYPTENKQDKKQVAPKTTPQERFQVALDGIKKAEDAYAKSATEQNKVALAGACNAAADAGLYVQRWKDVEAWARKSLKLNPSDGNGHANLATALLFQGKYREALKIFRTHWNDRLGDGTLGEAVYGDFEQLAKAGITHPDIARLRAALPSPAARPPASATPSSENSSTRKKWVRSQEKGADILPLSPEEKERFKDEEVVLLLSGFNDTGEKIYNYLKLKLEKVQSLVIAVETGGKFDVREYGEVIASGLGEPNAEEKAKIEKQYRMINFPKDKNVTPSTPPTPTPASPTPTPK